MFQMHKDKYFDADVRIIGTGKVNSAEFLLIRVEDECFFGVQFIHSLRESEHRVAYFNIDRSRWNKFASDEYVMSYGVTYEGIGNDAFTPPIAIRRELPVQLMDYWVGFDWTGRREIPSEEEVGSRLLTLATDIKRSEGTLK